MSTAKARLQFGLGPLMLWTAVLAFYFGAVVAVESHSSEWLVLCCFPALILGLRFAFGSWVACHVSAVGAGAAVALRTFFPVLPMGAFEVWSAFAQGCGVGYVVWLVVELTCLLVRRADHLLRVKST
ncbi:MAG: hypothetical protein GXX96_15270 [Planctomycetaceae bacterium]|nr:hypothetical protein [Planctomycetaceae bacterium]